MCFKILYFIFIITILKCESANILAVYPTPSISHQVVFRKLTLKLVNQGHEVTVITTDPAFPKEKAPYNLTEIDIHDASYGMLNNMRKFMGETSKNRVNEHDINMFYAMLFDVQMNIPEVQEILFDKKKQFDLILIEELSRPSLAISHVFDAPVILFCSYGGLSETHDIFGAQTHPLLYPSSMYQRIYDLNYWEKLNNLYEYFSLLLTSISYENLETKLLQKYFGSEIPSVRELYNNVQMLFLNIHSIWTDNRPVPPNIVYLGGFHQQETKKLPQDLKTFLDSSMHGVIYVSFGTNAFSTTLPTDKIEIIAKVLGQLPYDVLWKWDQEQLPGQNKNIKLSKWLPQSDLLKHPNIKLFITQAGLQSTDEAITAGVPLLAFPVLGDQWYNAEKYERHGIGKKMLFEDVTEDTVKQAILTVIQNESYRNNVIKLREIMYDQPQTAMERAVFWVEHVIRHKGATHLRAAGANLSWAQYFEAELLMYTLIIVSILSLILIGGLYYLCRLLSLKALNIRKLKQS